MDKRIVAERVALLLGLRYGSKSFDSCLVAVAGTFACSSDCAVVPVDNKSDRCSFGTLASAVEHCSEHIVRAFVLDKGWLVSEFEKEEFLGSSDETFALGDMLIATVNMAYIHFENILFVVEVEENMT